jgi:cobalamin biosynthesis Mg chelatase CobN
MYHEAERKARSGVEARKGMNMTDPNKTPEEEAPTREETLQADTQAETEETLAERQQKMEEAETPTSAARPADPSIPGPSQVEYERSSTEKTSARLFFIIGIVILLVVVVAALIWLV